jgi:hypothetical protein
VHPTTVDKRKLRKVEMYHLSWTEVLSMAVMQKVHRGVADPDQAWILGELIRYLEHPRSGAMGFDDMGDDWVAVRNAIDAGTFRPSDKGAARVASRWDQLVRFACLTHGQKLGVEVQPALNRKELADPLVANQTLVATLAEHGRLERDIKIVGAVAPLTLGADLRAQKVTCSLTIEAPKEGRPATRVNWLLRQLKDAPGTLRIDTFAVNGRSMGASELLAKVREDPTVLLVDPKKEFRAFRLVLSAPMGSKRGKGRGSFIGSVLGVLEEFYETTAQNLRPWSPSAPKLRPVPEQVDEEAQDQGVATSLVSTAASSQDGPDLGSHSQAPTTATSGDAPAASPSMPLRGDGDGPQPENTTHQAWSGSRSDDL